ncbi:hypothetical protein BH10PLA1_BH10PLA1_03170 [soil metagenome]
MPIGLIIVVAVVAIACFAWWSKVQADKRRATLAAFATQNGLEFSLSDRWDLGSRYNGIGDIGRGHNRYAEEVLIGGTPNVVAFRFHYCTTETRTVTVNGHTRTERYEETHWRQYIMVEIGGEFPSLVLRVEGLFDKLKGMVGFEDINFESEAFSRKYFCKSDSKEFAYALIHPQMMEYLLPLKLEFHLFGGLIVMDVSSYLFDGPFLCGQLSAIAGVLNRIPDFVWQDYAKTPPIKMPALQYTPPATAV